MSKEDGLIWLDAYEKMSDGVLKLEKDTAKDLGLDWVEELVRKLRRADELTAARSGRRWVVRVGGAPPSWARLR